MVDLVFLRPPPSCELNKATVRILRDRLKGRLSCSAAGLGCPTSVRVCVQTALPRLDFRARDARSDGGAAPPAFVSVAFHVGFVRLFPHRKPSRRPLRECLVVPRRHPRRHRASVNHRWAPGLFGPGRQQATRYPSTPQRPPGTDVGSDRIRPALDNMDWRRYEVIPPESPASSPSPPCKAT